MSETSLIAYSDREIESSLKDLLERILMQLEKYIENKNDLNEVEQELKDYEDQSQLVNIIKIIFTNLMLKIERKIRQEFKYMKGNQKTAQIQLRHHKVLEQRMNMKNWSNQSSNKRVRQGITFGYELEQQLKLHAESIQQKLEDSEATRNELLETTKNMMNVQEKF